MPNEDPRSGRSGRWRAAGDRELGTWSRPRGRRVPSDGRRAVCAALLCAVAAAPARPATYHVIGFPDGPGLIIPAGNGTFSATTLRGAIEAANETEGVADVIVLAGGVYLLSPGNGGGLDITDDLQIHGAGLAQTAIDAAAIGERVFDISSTGVVGFFDFTLAHGFVGDGTAQGGGIRNAGADLTLTRVGVLDNMASASAGEAHGGGIYSSGGTLVLVDSLISGNLALGDAGGGPAGVGSDASGGGIYFDAGSGGSLTVIDSVIVGNGAVGGSGGLTSGTGGDAFGGGIALDGTGDSTSIAGSTIDGNEAVGGAAATKGNGFGGGLRFVLSAETDTIVGSTVSANSAGGSGGSGGGIETDGDLELTGVTISGNIATFGAGVSNPSGTVTVTGSSFSENVAGTSGGGLWNLDTVTVTGGSFVGNSAVSGGGISNEGTATVTHTTLSGNSATNGGGIENLGGTVTVTWSTFAGNAASGGGGGILNGKGSVHLAGNLWETGASGENCTNADSLFDNGYNLSSDTSCVADGTGSATLASLNLGTLSHGMHPPTDPSDAIGAIPDGTTLDNNGVALACDGTTADQIGHVRPIHVGDPCNAGAVEAILLFEDGFESGDTSAWSSKP